MPLGLTTAVSATNTVIQQEISGLKMTAPIISNKEMEDIVNIVNFFEEQGLLIKGDSETIEIERKEQKADYFACYQEHQLQFGGGGQKSYPPTSFFPITSANVGISPQNFLNFTFNPFTTPV